MESQVKRSTLKRTSSLKRSAFVRHTPFVPHNRPVSKVAAESGREGENVSVAAAGSGKSISRGLRTVGKKGREWINARAWLKKRFNWAGITSCEFRFEHRCWGSDGLSMAHSRKRRDPLFEMYEVALACPVAHQMLDEQMSHAEMYSAVMAVIEKRGIFASKA